MIEYLIFLSIWMIIIGIFGLFAKMLEHLINNNKKVEKLIEKIIEKMIEK